MSSILVLALIPVDAAEELVKNNKIYLSDISMVEYHAHMCDVFQENEH